MGDIGPVRERYEVLPLGSTRSGDAGPVRTSAGSDERPFPEGPRENWLLRTARALR